MGVPFLIRVEVKNVEGNSDHHESENYKERLRDYKIGDILVVTSPKGKIRPRDCALLDINGKELLLSWGLRKGSFVYFRAQLQDGILYTGRNQVLQILGTKERLGQQEALMFRTYFASVRYARGELSEIVGCKNLSEQERRWTAKAILLTRELESDSERITALQCLYGERINLLDSDLEVIEPDPKSREYVGGIQLELW